MYENSLNSTFKLLGPKHGYVKKTFKGEFTFSYSPQFSLITYDVMALAKKLKFSRFNELDDAK